MSNPIPPLLCCTPPPIDFGESNDNDDDFSAFESAEGQFGQYREPSPLVTPKHENCNPKKDIELPFSEDMHFLEISKSTSLENNATIHSTDIKFSEHYDIPIINESYKPVAIEIIEEEINKIALNKENDGAEGTLYDVESFQIESGEIVPDSKEKSSTKSSRRGSIQSLELYAGNISDDNENDSILDFPIGTSKNEDSISLPSLKFDSIGMSKSATPDFDSKLNTNITEELTNLTENSVDSAFRNQNDNANNKLENNIKNNDFLSDCISCSENEIQQTQRENANSKSFQPTVEYTDANLITEINYTCEKNLFSSSISNGNENKIIEHDDFSAFNDFEEYSIKIESRTNIVELPDNTTPSTSDYQDNDNIEFEADFSNFNYIAVENITVAANISSTILDKCQLENSDKIRSINISDSDFGDDFDDFQGYSIKDTDKIEENNVDDEFGDFNDFKSTVPSGSSVSISINKTSNLNDKLKTIINNMFPHENEDCISDSAKDDKNISIDFKSNLITDIQELDTAMALNYQWAASNIKHALVKALGIDSRNILYGDKWNSSIPRFAANLGFSPLEPLKPTQISASPQPLVNELNSGTNSSKLTITGNEIPAVQFDWNSSGLVNPLDASHAHTLLLDLDQLVVVANLDKIKLDSSPCSPVPSNLGAAALPIDVDVTIASNLQSTITTSWSDGKNLTTGNNITSKILTLTTTSMIKSSTINACNPSGINVAKSFDNDLENAKQLRITNDTVNNSNEYCNDDAHIFHTKNNYNLNTFINDICDNNDDNDCDRCGDGDGGGVNKCDKFNAKNKTYNAIYGKKIICNISNTKNTITDTIIANSPLGHANDTNVELFDQYLDSRIKEIMHERKVEKIYPTRSFNSDEYSESRKATEETHVNTKAIEDVFAKDASCLPINNNDLKKNACFDEHGRTVDVKNNCEHMINVDPESITIQQAAAFVVPLKETHIFTPSKGENTISRCTNTKTLDPKCPVDFDYETAIAGMIIDEHVVKKEYRDVEYDPQKILITNPPVKNESSSFESFTFNTQLNENIFSVELNEFKQSDFENWSVESDNQFMFDDPINDTAKSQQIKESEIVSKPINAPQFEVIPKEELTNLSDISKLSNDIRQSIADDEFSEFQYVPPPAPNKSQSNITGNFISSNRFKHLEGDVQKSRTSTPVFGDQMILSPAVLLPQVIKVESTPALNWPQPGINAEELRRLEKMFPQPKNPNQNSSPSKFTLHSIEKSMELGTNDANDDDDWSDFVSVPLNTKVTTLATVPDSPKSVHKIALTTPLGEMNAPKPDEDDWSDFVSSVPANQPNFSSWNSSISHAQMNSWNQSNLSSNMFSPYTVQNLHQHSPEQQKSQAFSSTVPTNSIYQINNNIMDKKTDIFNSFSSFPTSSTNISLNQSGCMQGNNTIQQHQHTLHHQNMLNDKSYLNKTGNISVIPHLSFASPRNLINVPRNNFTKK